jgi:anti-sigma factor RsiW
MTRHRAPPGLKRRVRFMIDQHATSPAAPPGVSVLAARFWLSVRQWLGVGASFACGVLLTIMAVRYQADDNISQQFRQQLVSSHVRSLMAGHKTDVASSEQHTVKPWFIGKLDYAPMVIDLASEGFPLVGGRLDYVDGRAIAALVYARNQHVINLFVRPQNSAMAAPTGRYVIQGYNLAGWTQSNMQFWAVTDASAQELHQFMAAMGSAAKH